MVFPALGIGQISSQQGAMRHDTADGFGMVFGIARRAPDAHPAKIAAAAVPTVVGTVDLPPGVTATLLDPPSMQLGIAQGCFNFLAGVTGSRHAVPRIVQCLPMVVN
jgi:hypothetical protein